MRHQYKCNAGKALGPNGRLGVTLVELLVVGAIVLAMILGLTPFVNMVRARANKINCADNLRQISLGLHRYAIDHDDNFPASLGVLYPDYVEDEKYFDCPATKNKGAKSSPNYVYTEALTEKSSQKDIIVQDIEGNHKRLGKNVLRVNGAVEWLGSQR